MSVIARNRMEKCAGVSTCPDFLREAISSRLWHNRGIASESFAQILHAVFLGNDDIVFLKKKIKIILS
jgi:hypothetical protein